MQWFLIALGAPFLWSLVNVADQFLIRRYSDKEQSGSSGGLVIFSSLIGLLISGLILVFSAKVLDVAWSDRWLLLLAGILRAIWIILYMFAVETDDISSVVPWFLTMPVFGYILGSAFLGETLTNMQIAGSLVIFAGLAIITFSGGGEKLVFNKKTAICMLGASFLIALTGVIFKYVTVEGDFWKSSFWEYLGLGFSGVMLYAFVPMYRNRFKEMNLSGGRKIFALNTSSELVTTAGDMLTSFATLLAPVALVYLIGSFQPAIVLALAIIGTRFFPHIIKEDVSNRTLVPKVIAVIIMTIGSAMLFL